MSDIDICTLGATELNGSTNVLTVEVTRDVGLDGESEPLGSAPVVSCLGVTAVPAAPTADGHAEGVVLSPCGPYPSGVIGGTDTRCADVVGQMTAGDTALHGTHPDASKRAAVFAKENLLAILVGKDTAIVVDRGNGAITINDASGNQLEMSADNGIMLVEQGGAWIQLKGGKLTMAQSGLNLAGAVSIGDATAMPIAHSAPIITYMTALEVLLTTIAGATVPPTAPAVAAFTAAQAATKALIPTVFTKAS